MTTMSLAAFARRHDVTPQAVTKWRKSGLITMTGDLVDVEASDERLRRYRFAEDGRAQRGARKTPGWRWRDAAPVPSRTPKPAPAVGRVSLKEAEILNRLRGLDWRQTFDWMPAAQYERARQAARCVGLEVVESDVRDDGHWGRLQLRDPRQVSDGELTEDAVLLGHGFDAYPWEVIRLCRVEATPSEDDAEWGDWTCTVDVALLHTLAYPHHEGQQPSASEPDGGGL